MRIKTCFLMMLLLKTVFGQSYIFFNDSPTENFYDPSWGYSNSPSFVELAGPSTNKFPVENKYSYTGVNSLLLNWNSSSGGDWSLALAESGWPGHDFTSMDSIIFYAYTENPIRKENLPRIFLEDLDNRKTEKLKLGDYNSDIPANVWNKIKIPISVFIAQAGSADLANIKTIFFGQNLADELNHKLYIDAVMVIDSNNSSSGNRPNTPQNVFAKGYDSHIDISWDLMDGEGIESHIIYRLDDSGYIPIGSTGKYDRFFTDFIGDHNVQHSYKVAAQNSELVLSELSDIVSASTYAMNDEELLEMVQEATFRYFWDYAHDVSGLSRERYRRNAGNTVTSGGSGFGIMAILVGIERGFISRDEGTERILKIVKFLTDKSERFHGAWSHWLDGETGEAKPFSQYDDGGDIVETSFLVQGLLTARKYFNKPNSKEFEIIGLINQLWESVDWNFYRKFDHSPYLYWHWSPNYGWIKDFRIRGYMETLITYLLAAASPTHGIPAWCYEDGWVENKDNYTNGATYYGYKLFVGRNYGGPLFFAHYSYLGFDPRYVKDKYANYFLHNKNQTLVNRAYCIENPNGFEGYDENTWGLTASDNPWGYSAQAPGTNDNGTITPTAAISSMPYTPMESIAALKNMYRKYGKDLWGIYGFKDAFNPTQNWFADSYIAIDQGPIICMIENYRSELLWNYFMQNEEIHSALDSIGFVEDLTNLKMDEMNKLDFSLSQNYPNPFNPYTKISYTLPDLGNADQIQTVLKIWDILGREVKTLINNVQPSGSYEVNFNGEELSSGIYYYTLSYGNYLKTKKMVLIK